MEIFHSCILFQSDALAAKVKCKEVDIHPLCSVTFLLHAYMLNNATKRFICLCDSKLNWVIVIQVVDLVMATEIYTLIWLTQLDEFTSDSDSYLHCLLSN